MSLGMAAFWTVTLPGLANLACALPATYLVARRGGGTRLALAAGALAAGGHALLAAGVGAAPPGVGAALHAVGVTVLAGAVSSVFPSLVTDPGVMGTAFALAPAVQNVLTAATIALNGQLYELGCAMLLVRACVRASARMRTALLCGVLLMKVVIMVAPCARCAGLARRRLSGPRGASSCSSSSRPRPRWRWRSRGGGAASSGSTTRRARRRQRPRRTPSMRVPQHLGPTTRCSEQSAEFVAGPSPPTPPRRRRLPALAF